ncbi:MAG: single-stranded DNA-binding protein [Oscillospiraceae bacterium]|nr:single-stranded DNA-binding protein [Oscillospiraceae bacterium]
MLNHIVIMGRLTRDPELRRTQSGTAVCTITLAVDRDFQSRDGGEKQADFIDVVAWDQRAEFVAKYLGKGRLVVAEGSLQSRKWTDKNGQNRTSWEVRASNFYFADSRRDNQGGGNDYTAPSYGSPAESYTAPAGGGFAEIEEDGELPF